MAKKSEKKDDKTVYVYAITAIHGALGAGSVVAAKTKFYCPVEHVASLKKNGAIEILDEAESEDDLLDDEVKVSLSNSIQADDLDLPMDDESI